MGDDTVRQQKASLHEANEGPEGHKGHFSIHSACDINFTRCCRDLHLISLQVLPVKVHNCFGLLIWKPGLSVRRAE